MTDKTALRQLIEAVEVGKMWKLSTFSMTQAMEWPINDPMVNVLENANEGSLDAAKALHDDLLGDSWFIESIHLLGEVVLKGNRPVDSHYGFADMDPARAWLICILKAYEAQQ